MAQLLPATKKVGRKRKHTGAQVVEDNTMGTVKVNIMHHNDMTPIVKTVALVGSRVLDAEGLRGHHHGVLPRHQTIYREQPDCHDAVV
jgi:hypothetical protein